MQRIRTGWLIAVTLTALANPAGAQTVVRHIALGGADSVAVTDVGAGPAVVIVPGLLGGAYSFRKVVPGLVSAGLRVLVVDPLGTGASARPARADYSLEAQAARIERVLTELGIDSALFVCHSVGGSMCYRLALRNPQIVRGIVALNAGPDERAATSGLRTALRFAPLAKLIGGAGSARKRIRDGLIKNSADPKWVTDDVVTAYTRHVSDMDVALRALRGMAAAREPIALIPRLGDITVPVRLLIGENRQHGGTDDEEIATLSRIPGIVIERVSGGGQYIQEEKPAAVTDAVLSLHAQRKGGSNTGFARLVSCGAAGSAAALYSESTQRNDNPRVSARLWSLGPSKTSMM